jgi:UDP-N-acetylmuramoyl-tripeptide--D-alanyl-D-alanine ligase
MPFQAQLSQLITILNATPHHLTTPFLQTLTTGITTDSRSIQPGDLFVALRGEHFDGHDFVQTALSQGAIAAIVDRNYPLSANPSVLQVFDTLAAYQAIAQWWRTQFTIPVIAVTGSVGKTTTKELIAAAIAAAHATSQTILEKQVGELKTQNSKLKTLKSRANFNNEIGVPKTLLELDATHDYAIVEMGMRGLGEIALLSQIARPDIAVITNVGTAHIGRLGSEAAIAQAKCELLADMPTTGIAILNHDNPLLLETATQFWQGKTLTFGLTGGDICGELTNPETLVLDGMTFPLPLPGRHNALNYLAALAVLKVLGLSWQPLTEGIAVDLPGGRAKRIELPNDLVLLDETYNAGLESMLAALHLLAQTPGTRRIAVLGTMKELGERSPEFHHKVGETVHQLGLDHLLILAEDPEASALKAGAGAVPAECFATHTDLVQRLKMLVAPGDRLLFKASRSVGLDQAIVQFLQDHH